MLSDLTNVRQFLTGSALFAFFDAPRFPIYLLVIFLFNPWLGLFALVGSLLLIALAVINEVVSKSRWRMPAGFQSCQATGQHQLAQRRSDRSVGNVA